MSNFEDSDLKNLKQLLGQELELFEKLFEECAVQSKLLSESKIDELDGSLNEAQKLREKINGLHQDVQPLMQSCLSLPQNERNAEIDELVRQVREVTEKCAKLNEQNMSSAKTQTAGIKQKINEQSAKRKGIGGYTQAVTTTPEMFDKKT